MRIFRLTGTSQKNTSLPSEFESQETSDESAAKAVQITFTDWRDEVEPLTEITSEESGPDDMDMVDAGSSTVPFVMRMYSKSQKAGHSTSVSETRYPNLKQSRSYMTRPIHHIAPSIQLMPLIHQHLMVYQQVVLI